MWWRVSYNARGRCAMWHVYVSVVVLYAVAVVYLGVHSLLARGFQVAVQNQV